MSLKNSFQPQCITNHHFLYFFFKGEQMTPFLSDVDLTDADEIFKTLFNNISQQGKHLKKNFSNLLTLTYNAKDKYLI